MNNIDRKYFREWGVYRIYSLINGRSYIGSTSNLYKRINYHIRMLLCGRHTYELQNYYNEYGIDSLAVEILEIIPSRNRSEMLDRESYFIRQFAAATEGFNKIPSAENRRGWRWSDEQRNSLRLIAKNNGIKYRESLLERLELARRSASEKPIKRDWWIGRQHSEESRLKMSLSAKERAPSHIRAVFQYTLSGVLLKKYNSIKDAERELGICAANISRCCRGKCKMAGGFKWAYEQS